MTTKYDNDTKRDHKKCAYCGCDFFPPLQFWTSKNRWMPSQSKYCHKCNGVNRRIEQTKHCAVCGVLMRFEDYPKFTTRKTCSEECNHSLHVSIGRRDGWQARTLSATGIANKALALFEKPANGKCVIGVENHLSKDFVFVSPCGDQYEIHNLKEWVRNNSELFSEEDVSWKPMIVPRHPVHRGVPSTRPGRMWCRAYNGLMTVAHGRRLSWKGWKLP